MVKSSCGLTMMDHFTYHLERRLSMTYDTSQWIGIDRYFPNHKVTPVLIVVGGSIPIGMARAQSDIDIFGHHIETEPDFVVIETQRHYLKRDFGTNISPFDRYQVTSESLERTTKFINNGGTGAIYRIENLLCFPRLFENVENDDYQALLTMVNGMVPSGLIDLYVDCADTYMGIIRNSTMIHEKFVLGFIRFALAALNLQETGKIECNVRTLMHTHGVDFNWSKHFYRKERTYPREHWFGFIQKVSEKLELCKRNI